MAFMTSSMMLCPAGTAMATGNTQRSSRKSLQVLRCRRRYQYQFRPITSQLSLGFARLVLLALVFFGLLLTWGGQEHDLFAAIGTLPFHVLHPLHSAIWRSRFNSWARNGLHKIPLRSAMIDPRDKKGRVLTNVCGLTCERSSDAGDAPPSCDVINSTRRT